jgi:hypothetical protein
MIVPIFTVISPVISLFVGVKSDSSHYNMR